MSDHLSTQLLEGYGQRRLEAAELLALNDHLTTCATCRERVRQMKNRSTALLALRASLEVADETAPDHLPHEHLIAYARGRLDEVDRELADSHLEVCPQCAAQAQELRDQAARAVETFSTSADLRSSSAALWTRFMAALSRSPLRQRSLPVPLTLQVAVAVAAMALSVTAVVLWLRPQKDGQQIASRPSTPSPSPLQSPVSPPPGSQQAPPAPILLALNDGNGQITLDGRGNVTGLEPLSPADRHRVKAALETRKVQVPRTLEELRDTFGSMMGGSSKAGLALLSPVGKVVASDRPTFRWRPLGRAVSYQVTIADPAAGYKEVAASSQLQEMKWTVDRPLERGRVYTWQITARTDGGEVKAPEAKFKVVEQVVTDELARANKAYAGRRLVLGLLYAEAGLLDEAKRELKALVTANPQSPIASSLLRDLQSKQHRQ